MRNLFKAAALFLSLALLSLLATKLPGEQLPDPATVVDAEKRFAQTASERGIRESFLQFFAEGSLLLAPGPTDARVFYTNYKDKGRLLAWQPIFATISRSGDLGITTGPWELKEKKTDSTAIAHGEFVSVWKLQSDHNWKVIFDCGIDHPAPTVPTPGIELVSPKKIVSDEKWDRRKALLGAQKKLQIDLEEKGPDALIEVANDRIRVFRDSSMPVVGKEKAAEFFAAAPTKIARKIIGGSDPLSADLAYNYGSYSEKHADGMSEDGHFVSIWQIDSDGKWKIIIDLQKKAPPPEEK